MGDQKFYYTFLTHLYKISLTQILVWVSKQLAEWRAGPLSISWIQWPALSNTGCQTTGARWPGPHTAPHQSTFTAIGIGSWTSHCRLQSWFPARPRQMIALNTVYLKSGPCWSSTYEIIVVNHYHGQNMEQGFCSEIFWPVHDKYSTKL